MMGVVTYKRILYRIFRIISLSGSITAETEQNESIGGHWHQHKIQSTHFTLHTKGQNAHSILHLKNERKNKYCPVKVEKDYFFFILLSILFFFWACSTTWTKWTFHFISSYRFFFFSTPAPDAFSSRRIRGLRINFPNLI